MTRERLNTGETVHSGGIILSKPRENKPEGGLSEVTKATFKAAIPSAAFLLVTWIVAWLTHGAFQYLVMGLLLYTVGQDLYRTLRGTIPPEATRVLKTSGSVFAFLWIVYLLNYYLGGWGLLGFFLLIIIMSSYILIKNRTLYLAWLRYIERTYFGMTAEERQERRNQE